MHSSVYIPRFGGGDPNVLKDLVSAGMMGRKSGKGCYVYTGEKGERPLNTGAADIFKKYALEPIADVSSGLCAMLTAFYHHFQTTCF